MDSDWALDPRILAFPITKPPPTRWEDVSCVHGRCSRHWGLIRGLIEEQKKARKNRASSSSRLTATLFREVVARLSLSLEAVDTKDKFSCTPGVGEMIQKMGAKHLAAQVTARNPKHQPSNKTFVASAAAILVAMSREVKRRATVVDVTAESNGGKGPPAAAAAAAAWLTEKEIRRLAALLCEEDLTHRGDEIVLGEVENFAWSSMAYLTNHSKFDCVAKKDLDEKSAIAQLQELGERPICSSPGCNAYATKSMGDLSERVKTATFLRSVYCDEHFKEMGGGGGKRKKAAGKGKGKSSKACDPMVLDEFDLSPLGGDHKAAGSAHEPPPSPPKGGKIKAGWYRRLLGEALLKVELHRVEKWKGPDVANGLSALWRKEFAKNAKTIYSLTANGEWMATRLERAIGEAPASGGSSGNPNAPATASPILNRSSYASCSERDGGGGGGTAASTHNGHSPLAPTRANGAAKPGVRLLIDTREKRGVTKNSQISHLTNYLNSRGVPYEVREWKIGDYGWVVQPDAGKPPAAGEVGYEREFVVPRLLERKRVDDLAESMKDGRLVRQKKAMLRAKSEGVAAEVEVHVEGDTADGRFVDEIYRRGLTPEDLDDALSQAEAQGFKVVHHNDFAAFSAYLADATQALQRQFEARSLDFESFFTWQNLVRFSKGQVPLTPTSAAAAAAKANAAAAAKAARGGRRGRPPMSAVAGGRGRPPLASRPAGDGLRQRTLDGVFGVAGRGEGGGGGGARGNGEAEGNCAAVGGARGRDEVAESRAPRAAVSTREGAIDIDGAPDPGSASDSSDGCSIVEVVARPVDGGVPGSGTAGSGSGSTSGSKRTAAPASAGTSSSSMAGGGVSSAAAAAAAASSVRRTSPITLSPSEPGTAAAAATATSSRSVLHGGGAEDSPLPSTVGRRGGESVGRNSSRRSKRPRPPDEGNSRDVCDGDGAFSPRSCRQGVSGGGSEWGGGEATTSKKARSLSFVLDDEDDDQRGGGSRGGDGHDVSGALLQANGSGSGSGGGKGSGSSLGSVPPAASRSVDDSGGGGGVVDLSLDSPSPPVPPRSRPRIAVPPPKPNTSSGGGASGGAGTDGIILEACSSDDEFAL